VNHTRYAADTSFLLRLLTGDPEAQFQTASTFLEECKKLDHSLEVNDLVLAEAYFALQHHYGFLKEDALQALAKLGSHPGIIFSSNAPKVLNLASTKPGFVDLLIHGSARANQRKLVTFEKSARKLPETIVLQD
jgi:predicted nucleic acid-binding protein